MNTSILPEPFVPQECDMRGMPYIPLEITRLLDSDFYALSSGDEFKAWITLVMKSVYQQPAGSLPKDERLLEHLSGSKRWKAVRKMALYGWVECSDGRLYHPVVAEKVKGAWQARSEQRRRTDAARAARHPVKPQKPAENEGEKISVTENVTKNVTESVTASKCKDKGKDKEKEREKEREEPPLCPPPAKQPGARAPKTKPRSQLPDDWRPSIEGFKLAREKGLDFEATFLRFRDYHRSKGNLMASWEAAWGTWCRSDYNQPKAGKAAQGNSIDRRLAEIEAELSGQPPPRAPDDFAGPTIDGDFARL